MRQCVALDAAVRAAVEPGAMRVHPVHSAASSLDSSLGRRAGGRLRPAADQRPSTTPSGLPSRTRASSTAPTRVKNEHAARPLRNPRSLAYCSLCHVSGRCQLAPQPTTQDAASATPHGNDSGGHHGPALSSAATSGFRRRCPAHRRDRGWERRAAHRSLHRRRPPPRSNAHTTHESASPISRLLVAVAP